MLYLPKASYYSKHGFEPVYVSLSERTKYYLLDPNKPDYLLLGVTQGCLNFGNDVFETNN